MVCTQVDHAGVHYARGDGGHLAPHQLEQVVHQVRMLHGEVEHDLCAVARRVGVIARH